MASMARLIRTHLCLLTVALAGTTAGGQSLFQRPTRSAGPESQPPTQAPPSAPGPASPAAPSPTPSQPGGPAPVANSGAPMTLGSASLFKVVAPKPRTWQKHDKVEIIVNQSSLQKSEQSLETKKQFDLLAELKQFPSLRALIEDATLTDGIGSVGPSVGVGSNNNFKSDGNAERKDRFTARISATVIDVKPNGHMVLEATETQQFDTESKQLVVSGTCDPNDITTQGTVQSAQLTGLVIKVETSGTLKDSNEKGLLTKLFEGLFNF